MMELIQSAGSARGKKRVPILNCYHRLAITFLGLAVFLVLCSGALAQESAIDYSQGKADYWYKRGIELAGIGSYEEAINAYDKALDLDSENAAIWDHKAQALNLLAFSNSDVEKYNESLKAYDKAIELYNKSIQENPQDINSLYFMGLALSDRATAMRSADTLNISVDEQNVKEYFEDAFSAYEMATEINPKYISAWNKKGDVLYSLGRYNESLLAYDRAIEIVPNEGLAWYHKGLALSKLNRYEEAIEAYDNAIETFPEDAILWYHKGKAFFDQSQYDAAIDCYDRAIKLNPSFAEAWYCKGIAYEKLDLQTASSAAIEKAKNMGYDQ
jgi:tetratricopeptide (TPR) repeat protein